MKYSIFSDKEVEQVKLRHEARKKKSWSEVETKSAIQDMDNILDELRRTNAMVEVLLQQFEEYKRSIEKILATPSQR